MFLDRLPELARAGSAEDPAGAEDAQPVVSHVRADDAHVLADRFSLAKRAHVDGVLGTASTADRRRGAPTLHVGHEGDGWLGSLVVEPNFLTRVCRDQQASDPEMVRLLAHARSNREGFVMR